MIRQFKFLSIAPVGAICAALAMAGPALADVFKVEEKTTPVTLTGTQEGTHKWSVDYGVFECKVAKFSGTVKISGSGKITVTPSYSECGTGIPQFFYPESVSLNGCDFLLVPTSGTEGVVETVCPVGNEVTITRRKPVTGSTTCIVHIPPQVIGTVKLSNIGAGATREVTAEFKLTGMKYSQTEGVAELGGVCPTLGGTTNGTYAGSVVFTATSEATGAHVGLFVE